MCRAVQCILKVINVIIVLCGVSLIVTGAVFMADTQIIPGPLGSATLASVIAGCLMVIMGCFGYTAAKYRKTEGKETRGKCMLLLYSIIMFALFSGILVLSIIVFVWLGGILSRDRIAIIKVDSTKEPFDNMVACAYDACCVHNMSNTTCKLDADGIPDHASVRADVGNDTVSAFRGSERVCDLFSEASCLHGEGQYREDVGRIIYDSLMPFGYIIVSVSGILFFAWLFAVLEICWCCGESDADRTKVAPDDDDY